MRVETECIHNYYAGGEDMRLDKKHHQHRCGCSRFQCSGGPKPIHTNWGQRVHTDGMVPPVLRRPCLNKLQGTENLQLQVKCKAPFHLSKAVSHGTSCRLGDVWSELVYLLRYTMDVWDARLL